MHTSTLPLVIRSVEENWNETLQHTETPSYPPLSDQFLGTREVCCPLATNISGIVWLFKQDTTWSETLCRQYLGNLTIALPPESKKKIHDLNVADWCFENMAKKKKQRWEIKLAISNQLRAEQIKQGENLHLSAQNLFSSHLSWRYVHINLDGSVILRLV